MRCPLKRCGREPDEVLYRSFGRSDQWTPAEEEFEGVELVRIGAGESRALKFVEGLFEKISIRKFDARRAYEAPVAR